MATTVISLSALDGADGFRLDGVDAGDGAGVAVAGIGDLDGDGLDDIVIGASAAAANAGEAYVVFGESSGLGASVALGGLDGADGFRIDGVAAGDLAGGALGGGDFDSDGLYDLLIGGTGAGVGGAAYLLAGDNGGFAAAVALADLDGADGFRLDGAAADDAAGGALSGIGDINGDGRSDFAVGATGAGAEGAAYVIYGAANNAASKSLGDLDGADGFRIDGVDAADDAGVEVSDAGDVNGDGLADFVVTSDGDGDAGEVHVVFGRSAGFGASLSLDELDGSDGFRFTGPAAGAYAGRSVGAAGDLNGDGFGDIVIGAYGVDGAGADSGQAYVIFGKASGFAAAMTVADLDGSDGFLINGQAAGDRLGAAVDGAGDVNGDGIDDLLLLSSSNGQGAATVLFGKTSGFQAATDISALDASEGLEIQGAAAGDFAGALDNIVGAGDVNGDGYRDILLGAAAADPVGAADGGQAFVVFGGDFSGVVTHQGTSGDDVINGSTGDDVFSLGLGDDRFQGSFGNDVLQGGAGRDRGAMGSGDDRAYGGAGDDVLNGGLGDDVLFGEAGVDRLVLGRGQDVAYGGDGNDIFYERADQLGAGDSIFGGAGFADTLVVQSTGVLDLTVLDDFTGIERVRVAANQVVSSTDEGMFWIGRSGNEIYGLGAGNDLVKAGGGADLIFGGAGRDTLIGHGGDDMLEGGPDTDRLIGSGGSDTFVFAPGDGADIVYDFENGIDMIDLSFYGFADFAAEVQPQIRTINNKAVLEFGGGDRVVLNGVAEADLDATDFILNIILT